MHGPWKGTTVIVHVDRRDGSFRLTAIDDAFSHLDGACNGKLNNAADGVGHLVCALPRTGLIVPVTFRTSDPARSIPAQVIYDRDAVDTATVTDSEKAFDFKMLPTDDRQWHGTINRKTHDIRLTGPYNEPPYDAPPTEGYCVPGFME